MKTQKSALIAILSSLVATIASVPGHALDTDVYLKTQSVARNDAPNVLLILDNSGSMNDSVPSSRPAYKSSVDYCVDDLDTKLGIAGANTGKPSNCSSIASRIYFSFNGNPPSYSSSTWFANAKNNCLDSQSAFASAGIYGSAKIAMWISGRNWRSLYGRTDSGMTYVDCQPDGTNNGLVAGDLKFPQNSTSSAYTSTTSQAFNWANFTTRAFPTLYTANYMNYWYNTTLGAARPKIDIAKDALKTIINGNKNVRFGLMVFNTNDLPDSGPGDHGGRVIFKVDDMTDARRTAMINVINSINAWTWTPLAETMWEAYLYYSGGPVTYGNNDPNVTQIPPRDMTAEVGGGTAPETYISPFAFACQKGYIILVTDGDPTIDTNANASIKSRTGVNNCDQNAANGNSCLDTLTGWMHNNDLMSALPGNQTLTTYTVGFGTSISPTGLALLQSAATKGGGTYTSATNADQLNTALQGYLVNILSETTSFTAPSLSINAFNKQYNNNDVYLSVFKPDSSIAWDGNVKKYRLCTSADITAGRCSALSDVLDQNGVKITDINNSIIDTAQSYWSPAADGSTVTQGGAGANVPVPASRNMYTYYGSYSGLTTPSAGVKVAVDATDPFYTAVTTNPTLLGLPNTATTTDVNNLVNWMRGQDSYDKVLDGPNDPPGTHTGNTTEPRWAFGDPLHSRAVPITYGKDSGSNPIIKLFVSANDGTIRMINNGTGAEEWSFIPQEIYGIQYQLSQDATGDHLFGMDGTPSFWTKDINNDGVIDPAAGDKVYMFIGMRRGGRNIYAFDITPAAKLVNQSDTVIPKLMWVIQGGTSGTMGNYSQLGQTWSQPRIARIRYACPNPPTNSVCDDGNPNTDDSNSRVVLIFAGGYDTNQDNAIPAGTDLMGNAVYIVDPLTGSLIWWASSNASATLVLPQMKFGIPSDLMLIDSDGDSKIDRLYVGDMGGQIWRVDLGTLLQANTNGGTAAYIFADVGCGSTTTTRLFHDNNGICPAATTAQDRRKFFYPPEVAPSRDTTYSTNPNYDLVTIGSGDREDPLDLLTSNLISPQSKEAVHNRIYAFRDYYYQTGTPGTVPAALTETDLYDATANLIGTSTGTTLTTQITSLKGSKGWFINLQSPTAITVPNGLTTTWIGEKVLSKTSVLDGLLFVTTFTPANNTNASTTCSATAGTATEYVLNPFDAVGQGDFLHNGTLMRSGQIGGGIPSEVVFVFRKDGTTGLINAGGKGGAPVGAVGVPTSPVNRNYWYEE